MFGNLGASVNGNIFMERFGSDGGVKLDEPDRVKRSSLPGSGPFGLAERPTAGYVTRPADWTARRAKRRIAKAFATAALLPPKPSQEEGGQEVSVDVATDVTIDRPVDVVAAYAADPKNAPEWYANIDSVQWRTEPALNVGARVGFVARFLGRRREYTYEFVDYVPGERLVMRTAEGPFPWRPRACGQRPARPLRARSFVTVANRRASRRLQRRSWRVPCVAPTERTSHRSRGSSNLGDVHAPATVSGPSGSRRELAGQSVRS